MQAAKQQVLQHRWQPGAGNATCLWPALPGVMAEQRESAVRSTVCDNATKLDCNTVW